MWYRLIVLLLFALPASAQVVQPGTGSGITSPVFGATTLDASLQPGADDSIKIQNCMIALKAINSQAGLCDARKLTNLQASANFWPAPGLVPTSGKLLMPPGNFIALYGPIVEITGWGIEGVSPVALNIHGSWIKAGPLFPQTYTTGTVTVGTAGASDVITGVATNWANNFVTHTGTDIAPGCMFLAPSTQPTAANSTYGVIAQGGITSATSITLAWGINTGTGAPGGSSYVIWCPLHLHADGTPNGVSYANTAINMGFDCNNIAGCVPDVNLFGQQGTFDDNVNVRNFCGVGLDVEGINTYNSGPWNRVLSTPGSCGTAATIPIVFRPSGGEIFGLTNSGVFNSADPSHPTIGVDVQSNGVSISSLDSEGPTIAVSVGANTSCVPACVQPPGAVGNSRNIKIENVYHNFGVEAVHLANTFGSPGNVEISQINAGGATNVLVDDANSCTIPTATESRLGKYILNLAGKIAFSTSGIAGCGVITSPVYNTYTNCAVNSVSPAACGAAAAGVIVVPSATTTYTVNTTAVTANSRIFLQPINDNAGIPSAPTCATLAVTSVLMPASRVAGTSFTFNIPSTVGSSCISYWIVN